MKSTITIVTVTRFCSTQQNRSVVPVGNIHPLWRIQHHLSKKSTIGLRHVALSHTKNVKDGRRRRRDDDDDTTTAAYRRHHHAIWSFSTKKFRNASSNLADVLRLTSLSRPWPMRRSIKFLFLLADLSHLLYSTVVIVILLWFCLTF